MKKYTSIPYKSFTTFNYMFLGILALSCLYPLMHVAAVSMSDASIQTVSNIGIVPKGLTFETYKQLILGPLFPRSLFNSIMRVTLGTIVNMALIMVTAYPLSREDNELKGRNVFMWFMVFPMLFSGGLIPTYLWIRDLGLMENFWVLILPGAVPIFSVIMMMNFFRGLPKALYEAAMVDGANHLFILFKVYIPLSTASIATLSLFSIVGHWNAWFDAMIYINEPTKLPLQTVMHHLISQARDFSTMVSPADIERLRLLSKKNLSAAAMIISIVPILCVYPFLQKYFVTGVVIGSIKE